MRRASMFTIAAATACAVVAGLSVPAIGQAPVTAFEGARIIVGDGSPAIEKGTIVVNGTTIQAVGANVQVPAGRDEREPGRQDRHADDHRYAYPCPRRRAKMSAT